MAVAGATGATSRRWGTDGLSLRQDLWASFKSVSGPVLAGLALVLAVLGPLYLPAAELRVGLLWLVVAALLVVLALLTLVDLAAAARRRAAGRLPAVRAAFTPIAGTDVSAPVTLLLDPSPLLGFDLLVAIYYNTLAEPGRRDGFERLIGLGHVANIQENGLIQVLVLRVIPAEDGLWQRIRDRDAATIDRLMVKPSVPWTYLRTEGL